MFYLKCLLQRHPPSLMFSECVSESCWAGFCNDNNGPVSLLRFSLLWLPMEGLVPTLHSGKPEVAGGRGGCHRHRQMCVSPTPRCTEGRVASEHKCGLKVPPYQGR